MSSAETYISKKIHQFYHDPPRPRDERQNTELPPYFTQDIVTSNDDYLNQSSLNQSMKQNPLDLTNSATNLENFTFHEIKPLDQSLGKSNNFDSSINLDHPSYLQNNQYSYDNRNRDEFGVSNNNIIPPLSYRFIQNPDMYNNSVDLGITKSSVPPPPDYSPSQEEYRKKLLAELDDDNSIEISNQIPVCKTPILQSSLPQLPDNNNNIYPPVGLPVTMSPPQFPYDNINNNNNNNLNYIQESKTNNNENIKTTSSQIIESLNKVMHPFKEKIKLNNSIIDPPALLQSENEIPILNQQLFTEQMQVEPPPPPPDGFEAMRKSIEMNIPNQQLNIDPPIVQQSISSSLPFNNNNGNSYLFPPNIDPPLQQSFDDGNIKEIDKLIQQLKEENEKIKTGEKPTNSDMLNELNMDRELSDSDDETKTKIKPISLSSLNFLNHNRPPQMQFYPPNYNQQQPPLTAFTNQQQPQLPFNPYISSPPTQSLPSVVPVYGQSRVIDNNNNNNNNNNNLIGSLGNQPIYQAGTTNPSVILATPIQSQPLVTNGIPLPDSTPYINPIVAQSICTTISPPLSNTQPNQQLNNTQQQQQQQQQQSQSPPPQQQPITSQSTTSFPQIIINGIPVSSPRIYDSQPILTNRNNISQFSLQQNLQPQPQPTYQQLPPLQPNFQSQFQQSQLQQQFVPCYQKPQIHSITPVTNMNLQSSYQSSQPTQLPISNINPTISPPLPPLVPNSTGNDLKTIPIHPNQFQYVINTIGPNGMIQSTPYTLSDAIITNIQPTQQVPPISQPLYSSRSNNSNVSDHYSSDQNNINHNVKEKLKSVLDKSAQQRKKFETHFS